MLRLNSGHFYFEENMVGCVDGGPQHVQLAQQRLGGRGAVAGRAAGHEVARRARARAHQVLGRV